MDPSWKPILQVSHPKPPTLHSRNKPDEHRTKVRSFPRTLSKTLLSRLSATRVIQARFECELGGWLVGGKEFGDVVVVVVMGWWEPWFLKWWTGGFFFFLGAARKPQISIIMAHDLNYGMIFFWKKLLVCRVYHLRYDIYPEWFEYHSYPSIDQLTDSLFAVYKGGLHDYILTSFEI